MSADTIRRFTDAELDQARTRGDVIAADVALRRKGRELQGLCPFHSEKSPSFYVYEDGHYHCFGCGAHGDAISFVMRRRGLEFEAAVRELLGLPEQRARQHSPAQIPPAFEPTDQDTGAMIREIMAGCVEIAGGTAGYLYLWSRGLAPRQPDLRFHPALYCHEVRKPLPAIVAPIRDAAGEITAVQRIWVSDRWEATETKDARAKLQVRKKTLGKMGAGSVQLRPAKRRLGLAEGVETAIAASMLYRVPVWAVCGAARLGHVWVPEGIEQLAIFGDRGEAGEALAQRGAELHQRAGRNVDLIFPPPQFGDFNDELLGGAQ